MHLCYSNAVKIAIATPLYPPDVAEPAPYVKELAARLSSLHSVTILTYGSYPEAVPGVHVRIVSKQLPKLVRLVFFVFSLWKVGRSHDAVIIENGLSVELPAYLVRRTLPSRSLIHLGDPRAIALHTNRSFAEYLVARLREMLPVVKDRPLEKVEVLPLEPFPTKLLSEVDQSWQAHIDTLLSLLHAS
jgi:hypothetical protein